MALAVGVGVLAHWATADALPSPLSDRLPRDIEVQRFAEQLVGREYAGFFMSIWTIYASSNLYKPDPPKCLEEGTCKGRQGTPSAICEKVRALKKNFAVGKAKVNFVWKNPLIVYFDDVLSAEEVNYLVDAASPRFPKKVKKKETAWLYVGEDDRVAKVARKVAALTGLEAKKAGGMLFSLFRLVHVRSEPNTRFCLLCFRRRCCGKSIPGGSVVLYPLNSHRPDEVLDIGDGTEFSLRRRSVTVLICLTDVSRGGQSVFIREKRHKSKYEPGNPNHAAVEPKKGRVVLWYNVHPDSERIDKET